MIYDQLNRVTLWNHFSLSCVYINYCHQTHIFFEDYRAWTCKMTYCENNEGSKSFFFCRSWFSKPFEGVNVEQYPINDLKFFLYVSIIVIGEGVCQKTRPVYKLFNPQETILTLPCQCIIIIVVHWIFHNNIIIWVKVFFRIILMVLLIGRIGCWWFYGTCRGWLLLRYILIDLQNLFNKVVKKFVINFSVNDFLGNLGYQMSRNTTKKVIF